MLEVLEAVRRIVYRYAKTVTPLEEQANFGDTLIAVESSLRFKKDEYIAIHNGIETEYHQIEDIPDNTHIQIPSPGIVSTQPWSLSSVPVVEKCLMPNMFVNGIYIGDPQVIPKFPAITIMGNEHSSQWFTMGTTEEHYKLQIAIYVEDATLEDGYYYLLKLTDIVQKGLKKNIYPLVGDIDTTSLTVDVQGGLDTVLTVSDTSKFTAGDKILIEDRFKTEELRVCNILDSQTLEVYIEPMASFKISNGAKLIRLSRFIHNSWPENINYGYIHKDTLLKAATISWFAKEVEVQKEGGWSDPQLS